MQIQKSIKPIHETVQEPKGRLRRAIRCASREIRAAAFSAAIPLLAALGGCEAAQAPNDNPTFEPPPLQYVPAAQDPDIIGAPPILEAFPPGPESSCKPAIPGHNGPEESRINIIFVGVNYDSIETLRAHMEYFLNWGGEPIPHDYISFNPYGYVHGLFGTLPFSQNRDRFNIWYWNEAVEYEIIDRDIREIKEMVLGGSGFEGRTIVVALDQAPFEGDPPSAHSGIYIPTYRASGEFPIPEVGRFNHEFGHALGDLLDVAYPTLYGLSRAPNLAGSIEEAREMWGDLIGEGCGGPGLDCTETCYADGTCGPSEYETEVAYVASIADDCFEGGIPISDCVLAINRGTVMESGSVSYKKTGFSAKDMSSCLSSSIPCVYQEGDTYFCLDPAYGNSFECGGEFSVHSGENYYGGQRAATFRPHIFSIMYGPGSLDYGPANERRLCQKIEEYAGGAGGICEDF